MDMEKVAGEYLCDGGKVAVAGASIKVERPSNEIVKYLKDNGMQVFPVNPAYEDKNIHGIRCLGKLEDMPEKVDIINIIVSKESQDSIIKDIYSLGYKPLVWFQPGAQNPEVEAELENRGYVVVSDACIMVVHELFCL